MTFIEKIEAIDRQFSLSAGEIKDPEGLKKIIEAFTFSYEELSGHLVYPDSLPYGRKCIFRSSRFEVILMNWKPYNSSNIHDHGDSFGCVYSVSGKAENVLYSSDLQPAGSIPLINHTIALVPVGMYHAIENKHGDYAVSLHFYAPPLRGMKVIDRYDKSKFHIAQAEAGAWDV